MLKFGALACITVIAGAVPAYADESAGRVRFDDAVYGPSSALILQTAPEQGTVSGVRSTFGQETLELASTFHFQHLDSEFPGDVLILETPRFRLSETWSVEASRFSMKAPWEGYDYGVAVGSVHGYVIRFRHALGASPE